MFELYERHGGDLGLGQLLDLFIASRIPRAKIEAALASDPSGEGALRDRITADMANRLLGDMGVPGSQTPADVRRLRAAGAPGASTSRPLEGDVGPPKSRR